MDGKGRWVDNVFIERLWRSVKYEDVYLHAYDTPAALRAGLTCYFQFYNGRRRHSSLGRRTPDVVYFGTTGFGTAAARGYPDLGLLTLTEMAGNARSIARSVDIPVICDADTGYGNAVNVARTVHEYEDAGAAAIHLEDQVWPKRCGFLAGKEVIPAAEMIPKVRAACDANDDARINANIPRKWRAGECTGRRIEDRPGRPVEDAECQWVAVRVARDRHETVDNVLQDGDRWRAGDRGRGVHTGYGDGNAESRQRGDRLTICHGDHDACVNPRVG